MGKIGHKYQVLARLLVAQNYYTIAAYRFSANTSRVDSTQANPVLGRVYHPWLLLAPS